MPTASEGRFEWWDALAALPALRLRCHVQLRSGGSVRPGELRGAIGHRLMAAGNREALACFFPANRDEAAVGPFGHATPWALHLDHGGRLEIGIFADGVPHLVALLQALMEASRGRVGSHQGIVLEQLEHQPHLVDGEWRPGLPGAPGRWVPAPFPKGEVELLLLSPLRLRRRGEELRPADLRPRDLLSALMRRVSGLLAQAGLAMPPWDAKAMLEAIASAGFPERELDTQIQARYSSRQGQAMALRGLQGRLRLPSEFVRLAWPLLWMGQALHVGKTPCLGMGCYQLLVKQAETREALPGC